MAPLRSAKHVDGPNQARRIRRESRACAVVPAGQAGPWHGGQWRSIARSACWPTPLKRQVPPNAGVRA